MRVKITKIQYVFFEEYFQIKFLTIKIIDFIKKTFKESLINILFKNFKDILFLLIPNLG